MPGLLGFRRHVDLGDALHVQIINKLFRCELLAELLRKLRILQELTRDEVLHFLVALLSWLVFNLVLVALV